MGLFTSSTQALVGELASAHRAVLEMNVPLVPSEAVLVPVGAIEEVENIPFPAAESEDGIAVQRIVEPVHDIVAVVLGEDSVHLVVHLLQAVRVAILAHTLHSVSVGRLPVH